MKKSHPLYKFMENKNKLAAKLNKIVNWQPLTITPKAAVDNPLIIDDLFTAYDEDSNGYFKWKEYSYTVSFNTVPAAEPKPDPKAERQRKLLEAIDKIPD
jgi:hypothetical protein